MNEEQLRLLAEFLVNHLTRMGREIATLRAEVAACRQELQALRPTTSPGSVPPNAQYDELLRLYQMGTLSIDSILEAVEVDQPLTRRPLTGFQRLSEPPDSTEPETSRLRYDRDDPV